MSEQARQLINAIQSGDSVTMQTAFETAIASRIAERLDTMRQEVAQSMFKESIEDRLEAARAKAAAKGKIKEPEEQAKPTIRKISGKAYGGSKQRDEKESE